jgi:hypothetical protein
MTTTETYIVVIAHAVGNPEAGYKIVHDWDGRQFTRKPEAVSHGFELAESDDFQIGVVRQVVHARQGTRTGPATVMADELASLWWMDEQIDETPESLDAIGAEIGLAS